MGLPETTTQYPAQRERLKPRHTDLSSCGQSRLKYIDVAFVAKSVRQRLGFVMLNVVQPAQGILDGLEPARVWLPSNRHDRGKVRQNFADTCHADFNGDTSGRL